MISKTSTTISSTSSSSFIYESFIDRFKKLIKNNGNHIALEYVNIIQSNNINDINNNNINNNNNNNNNNISFNNLDILSNYLSIYLKSNVLNNINKNNDNNQIIVSVYSNHSFQLIISILSIFKLNLIYLPLDTSYPIDRLSYMINDSKCNIILTTHQFHNNQFNNNHIKTICLDCIFYKILNNNNINKNNNANQKWTKEQDNSLINLVNKNNRSNWKKIANGVIGEKKDIECHHRFYKVLLPNIIKDKWSVQDISILREQYSTHNKNWHEIIKSLTSKSILDIKDYCEHILKFEIKKEQTKKDKKEEDQMENNRNIEEEEEEEEEDQHFEKEISYDQVCKLIIKLDEYNNNLNEIENIKNNIQDPAYLIYTSGSTGNPKGVLVAHRGIVNFLDHQIKMFKFKRCHTRLLQSLPICFDASLSEIGTALLSQGTLLIPKTQQDSQIIRGSSQSFLDHIALNNINAAMISPSFLSLLSTDPFDSSLNKSPLETIVIGGETCPVKVLKKWRSRLNIINVYGPTEATVCTTTLPIYLKNTLENDDNEDYISLGESVKHMSIYLLDEKTREPIQTIGGEGEIYIGGVGVALEYYNNKDQTEKSFIYDKFANDGSKMFKTGDWGRLIGINSITKANLIEFRGRMDNQIKLNGSRIELDEISRTLENHQLIHQAVVDVKTINQDNRILVAYLILKDKPLSCKIDIDKNSNNNSQLDILKSYYNSPKLLSESFKQFLLKYLPTYMIPHQFIIMKSFPQNNNEKIDKSRLPIPILNNNNNIQINQIPNDKESIKFILLELVRQVFSNDNIESSDDLISNHSMTSILCTQIIEKSRINYGIILTVFHIYILRTIDKITDNLINDKNINNQDINNKSIKELKLFLNNYNLNSNNSNSNSNGNSGSNSSNNSNTSSNNNNILILGSTGFLGSNILKEMLNNIKFKDMNFYLLVRNIEKSRELVNNHILNGIDESRIKLIQGNIGEYQLGCNSSDWKLLCNCGISIIIHSAANVNMNLPFDEMIKDNIKSSFNIIEFINQINQDNLKQIHYISTLSAILSNSKHWNDQQKEQNQINLNQSINNDDDNEIIYGGYAQSKWLSEFIFSNSNIKNKLFIHRPAMICPNLNQDNHSNNSSNYLNYLNKLLLTCRQLNSFPIGIPDQIQTDITPINSFVSNFINNILDNNNKYYSYYTHSISLNLLFKYQLNQNIRGISISDWIKEVQENNSFYPFISFLNDFNMFERILFPGSKLTNNNNYNNNFKI